MSKYQFTNEWFNISAGTKWDELIRVLNPEKILEIGSYEGASATYLIDNIKHPIELHCIDTWEGGVEHIDATTPETQNINMQEVEKRFLSNTNIAINNAKNKVKLKIHKGASAIKLAGLLSQGFSNYFDFIYIDGSHQACDVLMDAVLSFKLTRIGGVIAFDDYVWAETIHPQDKNILRCPKLAIDSFINIHFNKIHIIETSKTQVYIQKTSV